MLDRGRADRLGSHVFRDVRPGRGYRVLYGRAARRTAPFAVLRAGANPPRSFYKGIKLKAGLNYVKVRDGIELAMTVRLPAGKTIDQGPFPTVVEYSGYQVAAPKDLLSSIVSSLTGGSARPDPLVPASGTAVGSAIAPLLGFAVVSVQMRGSGCSGGAFDLFDLPTTYDGYDAIEAVAAQRWVRGGRVGMVGISFSGITQLFTAGTRPPHLAAISPMSVTDDVYSATGYPGGIRNSGFATSWAKERMADARPAPAGGQPYARALVKAGDRHCRANQKLRLQTQDIVGLFTRNPFRTPSLFEQRSPAHWMGRIAVPTYLVGQWQDEQTGGHFASSLGLLARNPRTWLVLGNGVHADSLGPAAITRWVEFLKIYVAGEVPEIPGPILQLSGALYQYLADAPASPVQQSRFAGTTDLAAARAAFERDPRVTLLMDNGGGPAGAGALGPAWSLGFDSWPIRGADAVGFPLGPDGVLARTPAGTGTASYVGDPKARPAQTLPGTGEADAWKAQPPYAWRPLASGKGAGFATAPLESDTIVAGQPELDLQLESTARDTDLQVTLSEVRPDGLETYVQSGWLRASHREYGPQRRGVAVPAAPTHLREDAAPLPKGRAVRVRVPFFPVAHAFRAGSRIRVTVEAPGGDRPRWRFATIERGTTRNTILLGGAQPSMLVLPIVPGDAQGTPLPAPTALRGQPSRAYVPASNGG